MNFVLMLIPFIFKLMVSFGGWDEFVNLPEQPEPDSVQFGGSEESFTNFDRSESQLAGGFQSEGSRAKDDPDDPDDPSKKAVALLFLIYAITFAFMIIGPLIFACTYHAKVTKKRGAFPNQVPDDSNLNSGDFKAPFFDCTNDVPTCCHATFCLSCRAGDTYKTAGVGSFWGVVWMLVLFHFIGIVVASLIIAVSGVVIRDLEYLITCLLTGLFFSGKRRELRKKLGGSENTSFCNDFLLWGFCACCTVAQEARAVDAAMNQKVECCCRLRSAGLGQPLVGAGVGLAAPTAH